MEAAPKVAGMCRKHRLPPAPRGRSVWGWRGKPGPCVTVAVHPSTLVSRKDDERRTPGPAEHSERGAEGGGAPLPTRPRSATAACGNTCTSGFCCRSRGSKPAGFTRSLWCSLQDTPARGRPRRWAPLPSADHGGATGTGPRAAGVVPVPPAGATGESGRAARWLLLRPHAGGACTHTHTPAPGPAGGCTAAARSRSPPAPGTVALSELSNVSGRELIADTHGGSHVAPTALVLLTPARSGAALGFFSFPAEPRLPGVTTGPAPPPLPNTRRFCGGG